MWTEWITAITVARMNITIHVRAGGGKTILLAIDGYRRRILIVQSSWACCK
jgi:hypothetical protein